MRMPIDTTPETIGYRASERSDLSTDQLARPRARERWKRLMASVSSVATAGM